MNTIGILCPSEEELAPFLPELRISERQRRAGLEFLKGTLRAHSVVMCFSGVGKVNAALAATLLIERFGVDALLLSGVAGAIAEEVRPFDVIVAEACAYHDVAPDILTEYHPWFSSIWLHTDKGLCTAAVSAAEKAGIPVRVGRIVTGDAFIEAGEKARIRKTYAPLAVDMESGAVAHVCAVSGVPYLALRAITDIAEENAHGDFESNCERASSLATRLCLDLLDELVV